jgi:hypothetical protein
MSTVGGVSKGNAVETFLSEQYVVDCHVPYGSYSVWDTGGMQVAPNSEPVEVGL